MAARRKRMQRHYSWRIVVKKLFHGRTCGIPWLVKPGQKDNIAGNCFSIVEDLGYEIELPEAYGRYIWGSFQDWLVVVKRFGMCSIDISLLNPFSRSEILLPETINWYGMMVLSAVPSDQNYVCMLVGVITGRLAFWTPGAPEWHELDLHIEKFEDAISYKGDFYLLKSDYSIVIIDVQSVAMSRKDATADIKTQLIPVRMPDRAMTRHVRRYLVETSGEIILVCQCLCFNRSDVLETCGFKTYRLDLCQMTWVKIKSPGDWILFVGQCCSRSFHAEELGDGMANCIYFINNGLASVYNEWDTASECRRDSDVKDGGIFTLQNKGHGSLSYCGKPKVSGRHLDYCTYMIQASIAETFRRQSEALGKKRTTARATATAFIRRSQGNYQNLRGRRNHQAVELQGSDDGEECNGNDEGNNLPSADESLPKISKPKRCKRWGGSCRGDDSEMNRESTAASSGLVSSSERLHGAEVGCGVTPDMAALAAAMERMQETAASLSSSKFRGKRGCVGCPSHDSLFEQPTSTQFAATIPELQDTFYVTFQTSLLPEELEIFAVKKLHSKLNTSASTGVTIPKSNILDLSKYELQILEEHNTLAGLQATCNFSQGHLAPPSSCRYVTSSVGSLHRSSIETLLDISSVRAGASTTAELSLYSKLDKVTSPKLGWRATVGGDPEAHQGTQVTCMVRFPLTALTSGSRGRRHDD
ncbi:hypothetical protein Acr_08g0002870 [Actinidia rufa]|uniref:KIB1-4 beta-propeller domain-containing protein n=1 Tax=Actinidia rufa TaxID=165716 RepID=A0A7J0EZM8_9ERIC|nr:hypothetical protein Acr_08g0002870 [Actinidia rufa]